MAAECRHRLMDGHLASAGFIIRQYITSAHPLAHTTTRPERRTSNIKLWGKDQSLTSDTWAVSRCCCWLVVVFWGRKVAASALDSLPPVFPWQSVMMSTTITSHQNRSKHQASGRCWRTPTSLSRHLKPRYGKYWRLWDVIGVAVQLIMV